MTRTCCRCHQEKSIGEFILNKSKPLGYEYRCRECSQIYEGKRAKTPQKIAQVTRWHQSEYGKLRGRLNRARRFTLNPERYRAKDLIHSLVERGIIQRQPCAKCGDMKSQAHHPDYSKPLEVVWLCQAHHSEEHRRLKELIASPTEEIKERRND